jgi:hypothetical protein
LINRTLAVLTTQYGHLRPSFTEEQMRLEMTLWHEMFEPVDDRVFAACVSEYIREGEKFFPAISDIWKRIRKMEDIADGSDDWAQAWAAIKGAISRHGAWGTSDEVRKYLGDKLPSAMAEDTALIIQRLGWRELCSYDSDQEGMWRAQFRDIYNRVRTNRMERQRMTPDVARLISDMAQKMAADRLRLNAPKNDEEEGF